jgi:hypothetical protein
MISVLCPSRGRPEQARQLLDTIRATAATTGVELILRLDDDDPRLADYADQVTGTDVQIIVAPRTTLSICWNECAAIAHWDVLMLCGDDIRFRSPDWDKLVMDTIWSCPDRLVLVHGRDGIQDSRVATHPFMHRRWMETVGYFVPPLFASDWNDMWLTEVADMIGRRCYLPDLYTEHMHPVVGKGPMDQTHLERLDRHRTQGVDQLYRDTADGRRADADRLSAAIQRFQEES